MADLKPCPFCGRRFKDISELIDFNVGSRYSTFGCPDCREVRTSFATVLSMMDQDLIDHAVQQWNSRKSSESTAKEWYEKENSQESRQA